MIYLGQRQALVVQEFQTLAEIMQMAFGSGDSKGKEDIPVPQNSAELTKAFGKVFGI